MIADLVLWFALVLLFVAFRIVLFWIFRGELDQTPGLHAFRRCFETGLRSDTCAATWALLPSLALTLIGFVRPLGVWHARVRRLSIFVILISCAIVFVADVGYFAEYDNQFDHWIFGLIYDDRRAIFETIWKSYPIILLICAIVTAVAIASCLLIRLCRSTESADVPSFFASKRARLVTAIVLVGWAFVGAKVWLGKNYAGLKN
ncbi:MAG: hypothetical protein DME57_06980, partial [Verrucomicrobia bacterium]